MKYILSNLNITESETEYITDLIRVYFSIDSAEIPQLSIGVHTQLPMASRSVTDDTVASDVSNFINKLSSLGINASVKSITSKGNEYNIILSYKDQDINFSIS